MEPPSKSTSKPASATGIDPAALLKIIQEIYEKTPLVVLASVVSRLSELGHNRTSIQRQSLPHELRGLHDALEGKCLDLINRDSTSAMLSNGYTIHLASRGCGKSSEVQPWMKISGSYASQTLWTARITLNGVDQLYPCSSIVAQQHEVTFEVDKYGIHPMTEQRGPPPMSYEVAIVVWGIEDGMYTTLGGAVTWFSPIVPGTTASFPGDTSRSLTEQLKMLQSRRITWQKFEAFYRETFMGDKVVAFLK
jgi:hypothetical protein